MSHAGYSFPSPRKVVGGSVWTHSGTTPSRHSVYESTLRCVRLVALRAALPSSPVPLGFAPSHQHGWGLRGLHITPRDASEPNSAVAIPMRVSCWAGEIRTHEDPSIACSGTQVFLATSTIDQLGHSYQHGWGLVCQTMCLLVTGSFPDKTNPHAC